MPTQTLVVSPKPEAQTQVATDVTFIRLYKEMESTKAAGEAKTGGKLAKTVRHLQSANPTRAVVIASLIASGNVSKESAPTIASNLFTLAKPENEELLKQLEAGEKTVRETYKEMRKKQQNPKNSNEAKLKKYLASAAAVAIAMNMDRSVFVDAAIEAYNLQQSE